jgi:hypothetical protein
MSIRTGSFVRLGLTSFILFSSVSALAAGQGCVAGPVNYETVKVRAVSGQTIKWPNRTLVEIEKRVRSSDSVRVRRLDTNEVAYVYERFLAEVSACNAANPDDGNNNGGGENPSDGDQPSNDGSAQNPSPISQEAGDPFECVKNFGSTGRAADCNRAELARLANAGRHTIGYNPARERLFQYVDVREKNGGERYVQSIYSKDTLDIVVAGIPKDGFNVEHTWPQCQLKKFSRFDETRADMYHIFSVESGINGARGSSPFVECSGSDASWTSQQCGGGFEPPPEQKGITARAMFYMSVTYNMPIDDRQERTLREWALKYPVSEYERQRAKKVNEIQGNPNPFVEHPEWIGLVPNF